MESRLFKRILSLTMAVFMVMSMLPASVFAVDVSEGVEDLESTEQEVCPCADCDGTEPAEGWTELSATEGALEAGHYYVPDPADGVSTYQLTSYFTVSDASVVIDLRGNSITAEAASQSFWIGDNGSLTILDSSEEKTGVVYGAETAIGNYGGNIYLGAASGTTAVFNLYSGTIANGTSGVKDGAECQGGNIRLGDCCTVNLYGGEVTGGKTNYRGGNISVSSGTLNMYNDAKVTNGSIIDIEKGTTDHYGGNIYATSSGKINMYDNAVVSGGEANQGGNICIFTGVTFNMYGGAIYGGSAIKYTSEGAVEETAYHGPDLYAAGAGDGHFYMYGGDVGKTYCSSSCTFHLYNGVMSTNPSASQIAACAAEIATKDSTGATRYAVYQTALSDTGACGAGTACGHTYVQTAASTVNSKTTHLAVKMEQCRFCQEMVAWAPMISDNIALNHVYMVGDVALQEQLALVSGNALCMDMNGYDLTCAEGFDRGITANKATLNITSSATGSEILAFGGGVMDITGGTVYLHNITVTGGTATGHGGNIYVGSSGNVTLEDCTVTGGTSASNGGNICCYASDLIIKGDTKVIGGTATGNGGNIYLGTTSNLYMYSGEVSGGTGSNGEDICLLPSTGSFYLYDGTVGPAAASGNSLMLYNYIYTKSDGTTGTYNASFHMYGGTVDSIGVGSKTNQPASGTIAIYAGTVGNDPTVANYDSIKTMVAPCSTSTANEDGTYTVTATHNADTLTQVPAQAPTCTEVGWEAYETCETCGYNSYVEIPATGHTLEWVEGQAVTCTEKGWNAYERCTDCGYTTYSEQAATGHTLTQVEAKTPTCEEVGWEAYEYCSVCDYTTYKEIAATGHTYDDVGDCTVCDNSVVAKVTDLDGNVTYYATVLAAMQAANGTGATVHVMKSADENWEGAFPDSDPLDNVTVTAVNGVTITANSADGEINADAKLCVKDVTFSTGVNFVTKLYMQNFGTVDIYGNVQAYILGIPGGATLNVYGNQEIPATLKVTGSLFLSKATAEGRLNVYGKGDGVVVLNANSSGSKNALCLYAGHLYAENAVIKCDTLNLEKQGNYVPTVELNNATINITGTDSAWTDEYALNIQTEAVFTMTNGSTVNLTDTAATINVVDGETIELSADSTVITAAAAGLQNSKIVVAEGVGGCVWYEEGAYIVKSHNGADATCTADGLCTNCEASVNTATGHAYVDHAAKAPTCTEIGWNAYQTCENCNYTSYVELPATGHSYVDHDAKAPTCEDIGWNAYQTCKNCDYTSYVELPATGHTIIPVEAQAPTCEAIGWNAYKYCSACNYTTYEEIPATGHSYGDWTDNGDGTHSRVCANDNSHVESADHGYESVVTDPNCTEKGYTTYTCTDCGYSYTGNETETNDVHDYDDNGDCTRCDASAIAKVTYLDGTVEYYTTFLEALVTANGTGATIKALKNVEEVMQPTFADDLEVLDNVIIDSNPGVTIKDTTPLTWDECPDHAFNMKRVTFTENVNYSQSMILRFLSGETVINGTVNTYILSMAGTVEINGTLNNTGNVILSSGHVIVNAGGVWNANTNSNNNFVGIYGGTLELNGGTLNCDSLNAIGRNLGESESEEGNVERDATVIIRDGSTLNARQAIGVRKLNLTREGENTITLVGKEFDTSTITYDTKYAWVATRKSMEILHQYDLDMTLEANIKLNTFVIDRDMTITLNGYNLTGGPVDLAEGGSLTLVGENTGELNVTTSLEGKCVWVAAGEGTTTYTTADHVYGDWVEGVKTCSNCGDTLECVHETTSVVTDPTCETAGYTTHSCSVCLHVWTDTEVAALGHSYGDWSDNGDGTHSRTCATDGSHVETFGHNYESVVTEPNCTDKGYTTHTCTDCGYSYQDNETETNGVHDYDENGDCTRCGDSVIAKVTYLDGTVEYYKTFVEALDAADATGATVKALKNVEESFQPAFGTDEDFLNDVIIDANPGVTITDTTEIPSDMRSQTEFNVKGVTFTENVNFTVDNMILRFRGGKNAINGTVSTYITSLAGTVEINGTFNNTGNVILTTAYVTINEGGVFNANTNTKIVNFVGIYGGTLEINGGTLNCDNFKAVGRNPSESDSGNVNRDATVIIRNGTVNARDAFMARKLNLTLEGENSITVVGKEFDASGITYETAHAWVASTKSFIDEANYYKLNYTLMNNIDLTSGSYDGVTFDRDVTVDLNGYTLSGPVDLAEGGSLTVYGENTETFTVTTALEGKCVWVTTEGTTTTYITAPHVYGDWVDGVKACINCGVTTDCDHIWDSGVVTAPTCEGVGYTTYTCTVCGSKYTDNVTAATGHTYGEWSDSGDGETHMRVCLTDSSHIEKIDHTEEAVVTDPTCTTDGYTTYTCTVCGSVRTDDVITATGHTFDQQVITDTYKATDATCVAAATYHYSCSCGEKSDITFSYGEVDKDAHVNLQQVAAQAPGCESIGWNDYEYCDICGHTTYVELPATGHTLTQVVGKAPTCTEIGWNAYEYCSACDYTTYEEIAASGHILTQVAAKAPACTAIGWNAYEYCSVCSYTTYEELAATGHTPGDAVKEKVTDPTCTVAGSYDSVIYCATCGTELSRQTVPVDATGHDYKGVYTDPTNTANGYTTYTCENCGDSYTVEDENTMLHCAQNVRTGETYADVQEALNAAQKGDTIKLIRNAVADNVYVGTQKTLDLNGHELTAGIVNAPFATSYIIDATNGEGLLAVDKDKISLNSTNPQLPLWYAEGARFITVSFGRALNFQDKTGAANEDVAYYRFAFTDLAADTILDNFLANGTDGTGISVRIKATWTNANGIVTQYFTFTSEMVKEYVTGNKLWDGNMFMMYLSGVAGLDISFTAEIVSSANPQATVVIPSAPIS